jgi:hypothetical protein|tara:strand:+ start:14203 stop:14778 length:576 start_codon:yes stop_codon:yes gene_type:complete
MAQIGKQGINPYLHGPIPKSKIIRAIEENESMAKAAQSLHVSYNTFKKYARRYEVWKPLASNAGISRARKVTWSGLKPLDIEIDFQKELIKEFILPQRCSCCGESRQRKTDLLSPLIVHFKDGDIQNRVPSNLRFFCYNCYFIEYPKKHKVENKKIGETFQEQQDITEQEITGDELAKELGASLSDLFKKS